MKIATAAASQLPVRFEATSASFLGLKRVNTQLVEWSWIRGLPKDKAKTVERPALEIVVFVDESHEQHPHLDCAVEDDLIIAPPNSERPSANSTRPTSRPGSERTSSSVSYTSTDDSEAGRNQKDSLMAQGQEDTKRLGGQIEAISGMKRPPIAQRHSNLNEPRRYFQNHRDSMLLAQQRIFKAGGVSPERFMHCDFRFHCEEAHVREGCSSVGSS